MKPELVISLGTTLVAFGVSTLNPMFPTYNRPRIFRGKWGELLFFFIATFYFIGAISLLIWSFMNISWYVNILVIAGTLTLFSFLFNLIPSVIRMTAIGPIIAFWGLLIMHYVLWRK